MIKISKQDQERIYQDARIKMEKMVPRQLCLYHIHETWIEAAISERERANEELDLAEKSINLLRNDLAERERANAEIEKVKREYWTAAKSHKVYYEQECQSYFEIEDYEANKFPNQEAAGLENHCVNCGDYMGQSSDYDPDRKCHCNHIPGATKELSDAKGEGK